MEEVNEMIRVGLIGCGGISRAHADGWNSVKEKAKVVATADLIPERAKERANQLGAEEFYTDYEPLLEREDIDAVDICLPHYLHAEATIKAAERGKHVLIEKPMARNLKEAKEMVQACEKNKVILMVGHCMRFEPENEKAKEIIDSGKLGRITLARFQYEVYPGLKDFHYKREKIGGGGVISAGIHYVDLMRWLVGDVERVSLFSNSFVRGLEGEDTAALSLEFQNGAVGVLSFSWATKFGGSLFRIHGSEGTLAREGGLWLYSEEYPKGLKVEVTPESSFRREISHFVDCMEESREPLTSGRDAYESLEVVIAAYKSLEEGRIIRLSEI